jgi:hypothetical protein
MNRLLLALVLFTGVVPLPAAPIIREPGAIYFSDFDMKPLRLRLLSAAPCYFDTSLSRFAGNLRFPQAVQVEGIAQDGLLRIRGNAQQGGVAAWVEQKNLEPLPEGFESNLRKAEKRRLEVEDLIARNEVALGMTPDEVSRSLGRPQKRTQRANKEGTEQVWEYVKYELIPQTTYVPVNNQTVVQFKPGDKLPGGALIQNSPGIAAATIYIKVPVGKLSVAFRDGVVEALDQSEGTTTGGQVSVVIPPINVY